VYEDIKVQLKESKEIAVRKALGSPTEASLLVLAEKAGCIPYDVKNKYTILKEFSFSSEVKRMTTVCKLKGNGTNSIAFSKGAPERILDITSKIEINGLVETFTEKLKKLLIDKIQIRANQGYRTLAVGYRKFEDKQEFKRENIENDLVFLGFVSILDPPKPGVRASVEECESAGIKISMITGDHPATAKTIASQMRIYKEGDMIVEGSEISNLNDTDFNKVSVFARVNPSDKEIIIEKYQSKNHICAMTGDGINDALALDSHGNYGNRCS